MICPFYPLAYYVTITEFAPAASSRPGKAGKDMGDLPDAMRETLWNAAHQTPAVELRSAVGPDAAGPDGVSGLDGLLTSPPLLDEFFRRRAFLGGSRNEAGDEERLRNLAPGELADLVWRRLFLDRQPLSEAARTILTTLGLFGVDVSVRDLRAVRERFELTPATERLEKAIRIANLEMLLHPVEPTGPEDGAKRLPRRRGFRPVLCLTGLFGEWRESAKRLRLLGFGVKTKVDGFVALELRRFLAAEADRVEPAAVSIDWPPGHAPDDGGLGRLARESVLSLCRERKLAVLFGNAGTGDGFSRLWEDNSDVRFIVFPRRDAVDSAAALASGGVRNVLPCSPGWPGSHPSRLSSFLGRSLEALGTDFHACHSGARRPEELAGRWAHLRWSLGEALIRRYGELWRTGWRFTEEEARSDVLALLGGNAKAFMGI